MDTPHYRVNKFVSTLRVIGHDRQGGGEIMRVNDIRLTIDDLEAVIRDSAHLFTGDARVGRSPSLDEMVNRFLAWPLPKDFYPDCGISFDGRKDDEWNKNRTWPVGTNLFTAEQARALLAYLLGEEPRATATDIADDPRGFAEALRSRPAEPLSTAETVRVLGAEGAYALPAPPVSVAHARAMIDSGEAVKVEPSEEAHPPAILSRDTPRTDAKVMVMPIAGGNHQVVFASLARDLEIELGRALKNYEITERARLDAIGELRAARQVWEGHAPGVARHEPAIAAAARRVSKELRDRFMARMPDDLRIALENLDIALAAQPTEHL